MTDAEQKAKLRSVGLSMMRGGCLFSLFLALAAVGLPLVLSALRALSR